jgi:hypothetical protein
VILPGVSPYLSILGSIGWALLAGLRPSSPQDGADI